MTDYNAWFPTEQVYGIQRGVSNSPDHFANAQAFHKIKAQAGSLDQAGTHMPAHSTNNNDASVHLTSLTAVGGGGLDRGETENFNYVAATAENAAARGARKADLRAVVPHSTSCRPVGQ